MFTPWRNARLVARHDPKTICVICVHLRLLICVICVHLRLVICVHLRLQGFWATPF